MNQLLTIIYESISVQDQKVNLIMSCFRVVQDKL